MQTIVKPVAIIARIEIKKNSIVVYQVRSSNGTDVYNVTVVRGKVNNCNCPARKPCKHMHAVQEREDARLVARVDTMIEQVTEKQNELGSCDTCGAWVKPEFTTCARCLGY